MHHSLKLSSQFTSHLPAKTIRTNERERESPLAPSVFRFPSSNLQYSANIDWPTRIRLKVPRDHDQKGNACFRPLRVQRPRSAPRGPPCERVRNSGRSELAPPDFAAATMNLEQGYQAAPTTVPPTLPGPPAPVPVPYVRPARQPRCCCCVPLPIGKLGPSLLTTRPARSNAPLAPPFLPAKVSSFLERWA